MAEALSGLMKGGHYQQGPETWSLTRAGTPDEGLLCRSHSSHSLKDKPDQDLQPPSVRWYRVALLATMLEEDQTESSIRSERNKERNQAISFFGSCLFSISVLTNLPNLVP